ncbi:dihydroorotase family protein [Baekduia soli]|uniref:Dihydroorotase family protein n=1 Tax=Baekduia soli TaxID=496014 RepID=A0A5B8U3Q7_9ACTN|nr:dihydroorotase family protein [Baekduia soli]QEC47561.1 dihydroorotase family protein [Baekduia soli]
MAPYDLIVGGDVVLPDRVLEGGSVAVRDGRIAAILPPGAPAQATVVHDHPGRLVLPGLVDTHVHAGSFETESIATTTAAAAAGGVTTIVDMPYDRAEPVMGAARLAQKIGQVGEQAVVDVGLYGTIAKTGGVAAIDELVEGGVCAFKFSSYEYDARRFPRIDDGDLLEAFERLAPTGVPVVLHSELQEVVESVLGRVLGTAAEDDPRAHGRTHPPVSETASAAKALELALWSGARLHLAHCTHPRVFELIAGYRALGADVTGETCAHYLALDEDDVARLGSAAKVNPPIRDAAARLALWEDVRAGRVATISTDHAAWPPATKQAAMLRAAAGMPGLESLLGVVLTAAEGQGVALPGLVALMTSAPAALFGLGDRKGRLAEGMDADLVVFDAREPAVFRAADSVTAARWSPFDGMALVGRVQATWLRGRPVFEDGRVVAAPGTGRWLRRAP